MEQVLTALLPTRQCSGVESNLAGQGHTGAGHYYIQDNQIFLGKYSKAERPYQIAVSDNRLHMGQSGQSQVNYPDLGRYALPFRPQEISPGE